uniref:Major facilitator superfamily (MFS) profile domain-containing protein n=1 Tax=Trichogramma kaykai TaxID=54128 RepID=A0ABD2XVR4_9HYME
MPPSPMFPFDRFRDSANYPCRVSIVSDQASLDLALAPARQQEVPGSKHDGNHDSCNNSHKTTTTAATVLTSKSLVKRIKQLLPQALSAFTVWIIIVEIGITCVWCSPYLAKLTAKDSPLPLSDREASWVAAALFLGQLLGSVSGAASVNFGGSKRTCLITALPMALGWILAYFAYSPGWLYASRFSSGIGSGLGFSCFPLYLGEVADPKVRGSLVSFAMMGAPVGNLLGSIIGSNMSLKMSSVVFLAPCVLLFLLLSVMPDSPHHLVKQGKLEEARWAIGWYRGCESTVEKELEETIIFVKSTEAISFKEKLGEFRYRHNQKATILVMSLFVFMQLSGLNDVLSYMEIILVRGKFVLYKASSVVSYAVAASVLTAICCIGLTDRFGRRLLLIVSSLGVALSLSILGTHFSFLEEAETYPGSQLLPMISVFLFIVFFTVGLSSIPSIVASEVYSANVKPLATCLVNLTSSSAALVAAKSFQPLVDLIGEAWVFYGHVLVTLMVVPFAVLFMPETKGKSLQQIQEDFLKNQYQVSYYVTPAMAVVYTYTRLRQLKSLFAYGDERDEGSNGTSVKEEATTSSAAPLQCRMSTSKSIVARVRLLCPQVLAAVAVWLITLEIGISIVWSSPYLAQLMEPDSPLPLSPSEASWVAALLYLGRLIGSVTGAASVDLFGSKKSCLFSALPIAAGWILTYVATSATWLYAARISLGLGFGFGYACFSLYLGEVSDPKIRGGLVSFAMTGACVGNFLASVTGSNMNLQTSSVTYFVPCVVLVIMLAIMPDSPHHLVKLGKFDEAKKAIEWYRGGDQVEKELEEVTEFVRSTAAASFCQNLGEFKERHVQRATILVMMLFAYMQLSGLNNVFFYMETILKNGQVDMVKPSTIVTYALGTAVVASVLYIGLYDKFGRRLLMIVSSLGVSVALTTLGTHFILQSAGVQWAGSQWLPVLSIFGFIVFFVLGLGSIPCIVASEVYSANVKSVATCMSNLTAAATAFAASKAYQPLVDIWGEGPVFYLHAAITLTSVPYALLCMPETKGKSLQEIQNDLRN